MTEREKVSELSRLLENMEKQVACCEQLDPWAGIEARPAFLDACVSGTALIARLSQIDPDVVAKSKRLRALPQLDSDNPSALESLATKEDLKRCAQIWGQTLELAGQLEAAAKFCVSLIQEKKNWPKEQDKRIEFKDASQMLSGFLLYDLLDVLAEYEPEEHASLRLQVLCSYLKELRVEFIWGAHVRGPCRTDTIPSQCKFEKLSDELKGELAAVYGGSQHEFTFQTADGDEYECRVNNTGLSNYRGILDKIWDRATGRLPSYRRDGSAAWAFTEHECIQNLEAYASLVTDLLKPLSPLPDYRECARAVRALLRKGRGRWTTMRHLEWSYPDELDRLIAELDAKPKPYQLTA
ncbi:MAG: hypothetical protein JSW66_17835 [Phycisphaerales bacterium]|nr:MAG: hypothetical protein JSW66_17835 [Phycisphaerales bacterium]